MASRIRALDPAEGKSARPRNDLPAHLATTRPTKYVTEKCFSQGKSELSANFSAPDAAASRPISKPKKFHKPGRRAPTNEQLRLAEALFAPDPQKILGGGAS